MRRELKVLQGFPAGRPTTNPYLIMLADSLRKEPDVAVLNFSWRTALTGRYHVFHVHWPENLGSGHSPVKKAVRQVLTAALLARLAALRVPIVRTVHNVGAPEGISRREQWLLAWFDRQTAMRIRLNDTTPISADRPHATIPHGDYGQWFAPYPQQPVIPGRLGFVGLVRRYKGVERLLQAFGGTAQEAPGLSLLIAGNPTSPELSRTVEELADKDKRVSLQLKFLTDAELVAAVTSSELVVLPYRFMHNSGGTLAALSLNRPVLVPNNEINRRLAREVGPGWVHLFDGELSNADILRALREIRENVPQNRPDLSGRTWETTGRLHVQAYREAQAARRPAQALSGVTAS
jgi:beta-1,4-mannosyltransferase